MQLQDRDSSTREPLRNLGINRNQWYVLARAAEVGPTPVARTLWHEPIVVWRDAAGAVHALEDRCPHRQVLLSHGHIEADHLVCAYHGWAFDAEGACAAVPYLNERQRLPQCRIHRYACQEADGFIWVFGGDPADAESVPRLVVPEWDHLNYIATVSVIDTEAHFSFLIENLMDMYHGHLHDDLQAWAKPVLETIEMSENRIDAHYAAQSYYRVDKIWSISQLFFPQLRRLRPAPLNVSYVYPHWTSNLGEDFKIYCLFCPTSETHTRAYLVHFTSLEAFTNLHKLPVAFRRWLKNSLFGSAQKMLDGLVRQDVVMIEEEQQSYLEHPERRNIELNPAVTKVQTLIRQQAACP